MPTPRSVYMPNRSARLPSEWRKSFNNVSQLFQHTATDSILFQTRPAYVTTSVFHNSSPWWARLGECYREKLERPGSPLGACSDDRSKQRVRKTRSSQVRDHNRINPPHTLQAAGRGSNRRAAGEGPQGLCRCVETREQTRGGGRTRKLCHRTLRRASDAYVALCASPSCAVPHSRVRR